MARALRLGSGGRVRRLAAERGMKDVVPYSRFPPTSYSLPFNNREHVITGLKRMQGSRVDLSRVDFVSRRFLITSGHGNAGCLFPLEGVSQNVRFTGPQTNVTTMLVIIAAVLAVLGGITWYFTRP